VQIQFMRRTARTAAAGALALVLAACADEMPRDVQQATTPPAPPDTMARDTMVDEFARVPDQLPPGGYVAWIADIRRELPTVLREAESDRGASLYTLRQLYLERQEPLRTHFGAGGLMVVSSEMAAAVTRADEQFQEMMRQLSAPDVPAERLRESAAALLEALDEVVAAGAAAGLSPEAPRG
jgi:hypothetical protein